MGKEIKWEGECSHSKGVAIDVNDNTGKHGNDVVVVVNDLAKSMKEALASNCRIPTHTCTIFQVPEDVRKDDHAAYSPKVVSIGPFHRSSGHQPRQNLQRMEKIKWFYLKNVLRCSKAEKDLDIYIDKMKEIENEAQNFYSGNIQMEVEEFVKMMVLDGCFIIQLLLQLDQGLVENDPIYSDRWTLPRIGHDMLLLENQLPFFVLERLWELAGHPRYTLRRSVLNFFRNLLPEKHDLELPEKHVHHLLHLIHFSLQPTSPTRLSKSIGSTPTMPTPPQTSDITSSPNDSLFESPKPLKPTSPTKISQLIGSTTTIPCPPQPSNIISSPANSLFESPKSLKPTSSTKISQSIGSTTKIPYPPQSSNALYSPKNVSSESPKSIQPSEILSTPLSSPPIDFSQSIIEIDPLLTLPQFESIKLITPFCLLMPHDVIVIESEQQISPATESSPFESPKTLQPTSPTKITQSTSSTTIPCPPHPSGTVNLPLCQQISPMSKHRPPPPPKTIPTVTELKEAGVKFQRKKARSFLDVTFEKGLMEMPRLTISDATNSLFRNFIAFEQCFPHCGSHFTSYCIFMDSLINTPRDVQLLSQSGIIDHVLGSDEEVARLFNKLCRGITWDFKNSYLAKVSTEVIKHAQLKWPKYRAKLVRDYFSNPWAVLSLTAAIFVIFLTIVQTFFSVFGYFRPP